MHIRRNRRQLSALTAVFLSLALGICGASDSPSVPESPDFFRIYRNLDLAECLDQFKEREFFECIYGRAFVDKTPEDKFTLGLLYHHGLGVPRDAEKAARWYREAQAAGYRFRDLGEEAAAALAELTAHPEPAHEGGTDAMADEERAALAAPGDRQLRLASRFWRGLCAPLDWEKAMEWEIRAAESGDKRAAEIVVDNFFSGNYAYPRDPARGRKWLDRQVAAGDAYAGIILGDLLRDGADGPPDYARALELYEKGAAAGHILGWQRLQHMHQNGLGVERDEKKLAFLRDKLDVGKSVRESVKEAPPRPLGEYSADIHREGLALYEKARTADDYFDAGMAFADAAGLGAEIPENHYYLGLIQENGLCGKPNPYGAGKSHRIAALLGHPGAMMRLARLHEEGRGVRRSLRQAERWYARAREAGEEGADAALERVRAALTPDHREEWEVSPEMRKVMRDARYRATFIVR